MEIINADDFGLSKDVNEAIRYCFEHKLIHRASLMVNMPYTEEAVCMAKEHGFVDRLGLHINLVEGLPISEEIRSTIFCDSTGKFNGSIMNGKKRLILTRTEKKAIKLEIEAQIAKYIEYGCGLSHIDSHRHSHTNYPILNLLIDCLQGIDNCTIRLARNIPKEAISGIKGAYKKIVNRKISEHNRACKRGVEVSGFGTTSDFDIFMEQSRTSNNVEIMIHPVMKEGRLADAINNFSVEEWKRTKSDE